MSTFQLKPTDYIFTDIDGQESRLLSTRALEGFNTLLLGVCDLNLPAIPTDAIAAVFDLEGFTNFCKQIEPHLSVPQFLSEFLTWLMGQLKQQMIKETHDIGVRLYCPLPFFVKFMGDGLLVLWDSSDMRDVGRRNVVKLHRICNR